MKLKMILPVLIVLTALSLLLSIALGAVSLSPGEVVEVLWGRMFAPAHEIPSSNLAIVWHIRLPRSLAALLAGAALAVSGAAVQGVFRNPMASPDILGISAGSSFGAVLTIALGANMMHSSVLPAAAFAGAMLASLFVYLIGSSRGRSHLLFVILAGLAVSSFLNGMVSALLLFSDRYEMSQFLFWTMGGLEGVQFNRLIWPVPVIAAGGTVLFLMSGTLNLLALGDEQAHSLGVGVEAVKLGILALASLLTAMAISLAGPVGFVGLMVPHLMRMIIGADNRRLLPVSAAAGALFLLLCDTLGRILIPPYEIKTGIITSIIGGPYFIYLIIRYQRKGQIG